MNRLVVLLFSILAAMGCTVVDAHFEDVEVKRSDIPVPAAPSGIGVASVSFSFFMNTGSLGASTNPAAQNQIQSVLLQEISVAAKDDARVRFTDLSFIDTLRAVAYVPTKTSLDQPGSEVLQIANYRRTRPGSIGAVLTLEPPQPLDMGPLLRPRSTEQTRVVVVANVTGTLPTSAWKVDVSMTLSMEVHQ